MRDCFMGKTSYDSVYEKDKEKKRKEKRNVYSNTKHFYKNLNVLTEKLKNSKWVLNGITHSPCVKLTKNKNLLTKKGDY